MSNIQGLLELARKEAPRMRTSRPFTKRFMKWNRKMLREGKASFYADTTKLYNPVTQSFVKKRRDRRYKDQRLIAAQRLIFGSVMVTPDANQQTIITTPQQREDGNLIRTLVQQMNLQGDWRIIIKSGYNVLLDAEFDIPPAVASWWNANINQFRANSEKMLWQQEINQLDQETGGLATEPITIIFTRRMNVPQRYFAQAFRDGLHHCFFHPILEWAKEKREEVKSKNAKKNYSAIINKITGKQLKNRFKSGYLLEYKRGIPEIALPNIVEDLQIGIRIYQPFAKNLLINVESQKKPRKIFKFINTRFNHIDAPHWLQDKKDPQKNINSLFNDDAESEIKTREELEEIVTKHKECIYAKDNHGVCRVKTLDKVFCLDNEFLDTCQKFEVETGLANCKIDTLKYPELAKFIASACHWNGTRDFKNLPDVRPSEMLHIDQKKAYTQWKQCKWYSNFLFKITDFREVPDNWDISKRPGLYYIDKLDFTTAPPKFVKLIKKLGWFYNKNIYTHAELIMLKEFNVDFITKYGAYGLGSNFEFNEEMTTKKDLTYIMENGEEIKVPYYSKWTGMCAAASKYRSVYMRGRDHNYLSNLQYQAKNGTYVKINKFDDEAKISFRKNSIKKLHHIAAQITAYQRLNMLEQLLDMDYDKIIRVCVDGIYYYPHDFKRKHTFVDKKKMTLRNTECNTYLSGIFKDWEIWTPHDKMAKHYPHYRTQLLLGAGGTGKTYRTLKDTGFINLCYVAPSWKLAAKKQKEHGCDVNVVARFFHPNYAADLRDKYSVLFWDEASMLTEGAKEAIMVMNAKHIFAGDLGYQLPPVIDKETKKKGGKWLYQMTEKHFENVETLTKNYRNGDDRKLTEILNGLRKMIDMTKLMPPFTAYWHQKDFFQKDFPYRAFQVVENLVKPHWEMSYEEGKIIKTKALDKNTYQKEDLIICAEHNECNKYTERFKEIKKYRVKQNTRDYCNGEIIFSKPKKVGVELRHGFTIHSIQGETADHKLFIDLTKMKSLQMFYTAVSRARTWEQIFIMKPETG